MNKKQKHNLITILLACIITLATIRLILEGDWMGLLTIFTAVAIERVYSALEDEE